MNIFTVVQSITLPKTTNQNFGPPSVPKMWKNSGVCQPPLFVITPL